MKKKLIILGSVLLVATAVVSFVSASNNDAKSSLLMQNVEALGRYEMDPVEIICSGGSSGACYSFQYIWINPCQWTGRPSDYCQ